jgi:hypothetical protein
MLVFNRYLLLKRFNNLKNHLTMLLLDVTVLGSSIGIGSILAIVLSWSRNQSILWALIHACMGWFYVIYFAFTR